MTEKERILMMAKHAVGLDGERPYARHGKLFYKPYRNRYTARESCPEWEQLEKLGLAVSGPVLRSGGRNYSLTRAGLDWLGNQLGIYIYSEE